MLLLLFLAWKRKILTEQSTFSEIAKYCLELLLEIYVGKSVPLSALIQGSLKVKFKKKKVKKQIVKSTTRRNTSKGRVTKCSH